MSFSVDSRIGARIARRLGGPLNCPPEARVAEPLNTRAQHVQDYFDKDLQNDCEDFGHDLSSEIRVSRPMLFGEQSGQLPWLARATVVRAAPRSAD